MSQLPSRFLFLYLNTGGGHCSAASAAAQALRNLCGERALVDLVDVTADYLDWPLNRLDDIYNQLVRLRGWPWAVVYHLTDGPYRIALLEKGWWLLIREACQQLLRDHRADVIVCCHPLLKAPLLQALDELESPPSVVTLVTDLTAGHASWFVPGDARCLVPTETTRRSALSCGLPPKRIRVTGLPVGLEFVAPAQENGPTARRRLGLAPDLPTVLLMSGADGMGDLLCLCRALSSDGLSAQLAVIAGRNEKLRDDLLAEDWPLPVQVKGFVHNMHQWMQAADLLVTKAGPSTISEALVMGLPMVLSGALPGQERPNVDYVVEGGAGVWAPGPEGAAAAVRDLLEDESAQAQMSKRARALAHPDAAWRVAEIVWNSANGKLA